MPSTWAHFDWWTVWQPVSAQNVICGPRSSITLAMLAPSPTIVAASAPIVVSFTRSSRFRMTLEPALCHARFLKTSRADTQR